MAELDLPTLHGEMVRRGLAPPLAIQYLFDEQRRFVDDPAPLKAVLCPRRSGKSYGAASYLLITAQRQPNVPCIYIALTRRSAKKILWDSQLSGVPALAQRDRLDVKLNHTDLSCSFPNGSRIDLTGADDARMLDRLRGDRYGLAIVDEAAFFGNLHLTQLVRDVLRPAMMDLRGTLVLMCSPGIVPKGLFHDATTGALKNWSRHSWTVFKNRAIRDPAAFLREEREMHGWSENHPTYRREYLGEWIADASMLVFKVESKNRVATLTDRKDWHYCLGIDFGFIDSTAFTVLAYREAGPPIFTVLSEKRPGLTPSGAAERALELQKQFGGFERIVGDVGGLGKGYAEEMRQRFAIPIEPAMKTDKRGMIELLNGDLQQGDLLIVEPGCQPLLDEIDILPWAPRKRTAPTDGNWQEEADPRYECHCVDSWLYGWRETKAWLARHAPVKPLPQDEQDAMFERSIREVMDEREEMDYG